MIIFLSLLNKYRQSGKFLLRFSDELDLAGLKLPVRNTTENRIEMGNSANDSMADNAPPKIEDGISMEVDESAGSNSNDNNRITSDVSATSENKATGVDSDVSRKDAVVTPALPFLIPADAPACCVQALHALIECEDLVALHKAVTIMRKYVKNILQEPFVPKYRSISTNNATYQQKVRAVQGTDAFLRAIGFLEREEEIDGSSRSYLHLPLLASAEATASGSEQGGGQGGHSDQIRALQKSEQLLENMESYLAQQLSITNAAAAPSSSVEPSSTFDPFHTHIVRINPQV